jgi:hypothetical protein
MPTKDPHIAAIGAHDELEQIKARVKQAVALVRRRAVQGFPLTTDDQLMIKAIRAEAIDATKRVQERLYEELEGHTKQGGTIE